MNWRLGLVLSFVIGCVVAEAQSPGRVTVRDVRAFGRGCPQGTVSAVVTDDGRTFSLMMDEYIATADWQRALVRKDCDIQIDLDIPAGWRYAIVGADYRGYVDASAGAVGTHQVIYSYDGRRPKNEEPGFEDGNGYAFRATEFRGPVSRDYLIRNTIELSRAPRSPCSFGGVQTLYMSTFLMARSNSRQRNSQATISMDSLDGAVSEQQFRLSWFQCDRFSTPPSRPTDPSPPPSRPPRDPGLPPRFGG